MIGHHPSIIFDISKFSQREQNERLIRAAMIAEANRGHNRRSGSVITLRRALGAVLIGAGNWILGEPAKRVDLQESAGSASLKLAR